MQFIKETARAAAGLTAPGARGADAPPLTRAPPSHERAPPRPTREPRYHALPHGPARSLLGRALWGGPRAPSRRAAAVPSSCSLAAVPRSVQTSVKLRSLPNPPRAPSAPNSPRHRGRARGGRAVSHLPSQGPPHPDRGGTSPRRAPSRPPPSPAGRPAGTGQVGSRGRLGIAAPSFCARLFPRPPAAPRGLKRAGLGSVRSVLIGTGFFFRVNFAVFHSPAPEFVTELSSLVLLLLFCHLYVPNDAVGMSGSHLHPAQTGAPGPALHHAVRPAAQLGSGLPWKTPQ